MILNVGDTLTNEQGHTFLIEKIKEGDTMYGGYAIGKVTIPDFVVSVRNIVLASDESKWRKNDE